MVTETDPPLKRPCHSIREEGAGAGERARPPLRCESMGAKSDDVTILGWNVASLRRRLKKNLQEMINEVQRIRPGIIVLTEVRCQLEDLQRSKEWREFLEKTGMKMAAFHSNPNTPDKKGLHGAIVLIEAAETAECDIGFATGTDLQEGRLVTALLPWATVVTPYVPCKQDDKIPFLSELSKHIAMVRRDGIPTIVIGDFNVAPNPVDANVRHIPPEKRGGVDGCTWKERQQLAALVRENGLVDAWTLTHSQRSEKDHTWYSGTRTLDYATSMRIDLALIDEGTSKNVLKCEKTETRMGSDHYGLLLKIRKPDTDGHVVMAIHEGIRRIEETARREKAIKEIRTHERIQRDATMERERRRTFLRGKKPCASVKTTSGEIIQVLMDSGAMPTCIRRETLRRCWPGVRIPMDPKHQAYLRMANDTLVGPVPIVTLPAEIAGTVIELKAHVLDQCPYEMLLGWEDMVLSGIDMITTQGKATITDEQGVARDIELAYREGIPFLSQTTMVVSKDTKIPPHGVYAVRVSFENLRAGPGRRRDIEGLIETFSSNPDFLPGRLQHVVWDANKGYAKVQIRNTTDKPRTLHRGTPIGSFHMERPEITTVDPLLMVDITREQIGEIVKDAIVEHPGLKEAICSWLANALQIIDNKPKNPEELKKAVLAMTE